MEPTFRKLGNTWTLFVVQLYKPLLKDGLGSEISSNIPIDVHTITQIYETSINSSMIVTKTGSYRVLIPWKIMLKCYEDCLKAEQLADIKQQIADIQKQRSQLYGQIVALDLQITNINKV